MAATYTVKQVAEILGYSTNSIYTFLKEKRIKGVRVGRGRFRVPQAELDRLLSTEKSSKAGQQGDATAQFATMIAEASRQMAVKPDGVVEAGYVTGPAGGLLARRVSVPSYFDWFVGLASILLGLSLSLFSKTFETAATGLFVSMKPTIQTALVAGGVGLLLTDIRGQSKAIWHWVFHGILVLAYVAYAAMLISFKDMYGMLFFGGLGVALALGGILRWGGVGSFTLYVAWIIGFAGPVALVFYPHDALVAPWLQALAVMGPAIPYSIAVASVVLAAVLGVAYRTNTRAFQILMVMAGVTFSLFSFWFAAANYWNRSLFILFTGFFCLFTPVWIRHSFAHPQERPAVFSLFGAVFALYMVAIAVIYVFQLNMYEYASGNIQRKLGVVRIMVESTLEQNQAVIEGMALNPTVTRAFAKKDIEAFSEIARGLFDANTTMRRLFFVDADGTILFSYPLTNTSAIPNAAFREYFTVPVATKKPYVSDFFEIRAETPLKVITISAPVLGSNASVVGVVVGSVDLARLGGRLQEITSNDLGEYVTIVDKHGTRVIHPDPVLVGASLPPDDALRLALKGDRGITESSASTRDRVLMAYGPVGKFGWGLGIKIPLRTVLAPTGAASVVTVSLLSLTMVCIGLYMAVRQYGRIPVVGRLAKVGDEGDGKNKPRAIAKLTDTS